MVFARLRVEHGLAAIAFFSPLSKTFTNASFVATGLLFAREWRAGRIAPRATPLDGAILLWAVSQVLSTIASVDPLESFRDLRSLGHWGLFYLTAWGVAAGARLERLIAIFLFAGALAALQGLAEVTLGFDLLHEAGSRASGFFTGHLPFGHFQTLLFAIALALLLESRRRATQIGTAALAVLYAAAVVASKGRGPWLALAVTALLIAFRGVPRRLLLAFAVVAALQIGMVAYEPGGLGAYYESYVVLEDTADGEVPDETVYSNLWRLSMWREGLRLFSLRPVLGTGVESIGALSREFRVPFPDFGVAHLHSNYLEVLATRGLVGLAALIALGMSFVVVLRDAAARVPAGIRRAAVIGALAAVVVHAVHGLTYYSIGSAPVQMGFYWVAGLGVGSLLREPATGRPGPIPVAQVGWVAAVTAVMLLAQPLLAARAPIALGAAAVAVADACWRWLGRDAPLVQTALLLAFGLVAIAVALLLLPAAGGAVLGMQVLVAAAAAYSIGHLAIRLIAVGARVPARR